MSVTELDAAVKAQLASDTADTVNEVTRLIVAGSAAAALVLAKACWSTIEKHADPLPKADCQRVLGLAYQSMGDTKESLRACYHAITLYESAGHPAGAARTLSLAAIAQVRLGDTEEGLGMLARALALADGLDDAATKSRIWVNMSVVHDELENFDEAVAAAEMAVNIGQRVSDDTLMARATANLQAYRVRQKTQAFRLDPSDAQRAALRAEIDAARQFIHHTPDRTMAVSMQTTIGTAELAMGHVAESRAALAEALAMAEQTGEHFAGATILLTLAEADALAGDRAAAHDNVCKALRLSEEHGRQDDVATCRLRLSELHESAGDTAGALRHFRSYHQAFVTGLRAQASIRSQVLAIRLDSERSRLESELHKLRATQLEQENLQLQSRAEQLDRDANEDTLTGLGNRRFFEQAIRRTVAAAPSASVVMGIADIDFFKQVNDRFSHATGDVVLQQIGALFKRHCRGHDLVARFGGEEFVLAFVNASPDEACDASERLRQAIERFDWAGIHPDLKVTISLGLAACSAPHDIDATLKEADVALYAAKHAGRNRVCLQKPA